MPEELKPGGLSGPAQDDPATLAAWADAERLQGKLVYDVNGVRLGKVARAFAEDGAMLRFDVTLSDDTRRDYGAEQKVAGVPPHWVARVDDDGVRLMKAAEQVLHPDDPTPPGAEPDRGAKGQPRKVR